jgi:hypothetical protein
MATTARGWVKAKWAWVKRNPLFWANAGLILITTAFVCIWPAPIIDGVASDFRIRSWGLFLQLLGVFTVWLDLTTAARDLGKEGDGFFKNTLTWLRDGMFGYRPIVGTINALVGLAGVEARGKAGRMLSPNASLEDRITAIEAYIVQVDSNVDAAVQQLGELRQALGAKIREEGDERRRAIDDLRETIGTAVAGNYAVLVFGVVWLTVGLVLATLAPEFAKVAAWQWLSVWRAM